MVVQVTRNIEELHTAVKKSRPQATLAMALSLQMILVPW